MRPHPTHTFPRHSAPLSEDKFQLKQLTAQVSEIAQKMTQLVAAKSDVKIEPMPTATPETLRQMLAARRARAQFFSPGLFADPAWDILLDLFMARLAQVRVSTSSLCEASNVPSTTALRWIKLLERDGLVMRRDDPFDGRRVFIELTAKGENSLERFFASVGFHFIL